jgi:hypothetical protein
VAIFTVSHFLPCAVAAEIARVAPRRDTQTILETFIAILHKGLACPGLLLAIAKARHAQAGPRQESLSGMASETA